jgi:DNA-binding MarR family transcriptional regulator
MPEINDNELAASLRMAMSRLIKVIRNEVRHDESLSLTERSTLSMIYQHQQLLPSELAAKEKVTSQSMSQIIHKLHLHGYVEKTPSTEDKRKVIITITSKGKQFIEEKRSRSMEWLEKAISERTTEAERETLKDAIEVLTKLVD